MARTSEDRAWIAANVCEWDEFGQGYTRDDEGFRLGVCICGLVMRTREQYSNHACPADDPGDDDA